MPKALRKVDNSKIFFHLKWNFDYRRSCGLVDALHSSIRRLYFENKDNPDIYDIVDARIHVIRTRINAEIDAYNRFKSYLRFYWSEDEPDVLIGSACILPTDSKEEQECKRKLGNAFVLEDILINLKPESFEELCKKILRELECQFVGKTRTTADGGVDFFGTLEIDKVDDNPLLRKFNIIPNARIHFVGQAKRYRDFNVIHPSHIREFLGSAVLLEFTQAWNLQKELSIENMPPKYLLPRDPTIWMFFTTSFATTNARKLAHSLGIHLQDGEDISRWLALNPLADCEADKDRLAHELNKWIYA